MRVAMRHTGNGVVIRGLSGAVYQAEPNEVVELLEADAAGLTDHPEWEPAQVENEGDDTE